MSIASKTGKPRLWRLAALVAICVCTTAAQGIPPRIVIPDGTEIRLRLAQPLSAQGLLLVGKSARKRSPVRLVVAGDVRIAGRLVIAGGAAAQATVTNVYPPGSTLSATGIELRLDWTASINGVEVPLRAAKDGARGPFMLQVIGVQGGTLARPSRKHGAATALFTLGMNTLYEKSTAPAGTRMFAYVDGDIPLNATEIEQAQARFPALNPRALVSIYRLKGNPNKRSPVTCDGSPVAELSQGQYITLELPAGKHTVSVPGAKPVQISVVAGEEYYLRLQTHRIGASELTHVSAFEGEDGVAAAEMVLKR